VGLILLQGAQMGAVGLNHWTGGVYTMHTVCLRVRMWSDYSDVWPDFDEICINWYLIGPEFNRDFLWCDPSVFFYVL